MTLGAKLSKHKPRRRADKASCLSIIIALAINCTPTSKTDIGVSCLPTYPEFSVIVLVHKGWIFFLFPSGTLVKRTTLKLTR